MTDTNNYPPMSDVELWLAYCETGKTDSVLLEEIDRCRLREIPIVRWDRHKTGFGEPINGNGLGINKEVGQHL